MALPRAAPAALQAAVAAEEPSNWWEPPRSLGPQYCLRVRELHWAKKLRPLLIEPPGWAVIDCAGGLVGQKFQGSMAVLQDR